MTNLNDIEWHEWKFPTHTYSASHKEGKYTYSLSVVDNSALSDTYWQLHKWAMDAEIKGCCASTLVRDGYTGERDIEGGKKAVIDALIEEMYRTKRIESIEDAHIIDFDEYGVGSIEYTLATTGITYEARECFKTWGVTCDVTSLDMYDRNGDLITDKNIPANTSDDDIARMVAEMVERFW